MKELTLFIKLQFLLISQIYGQSYLEIPPVKLLTVGSVANRFPAAGSVENGGYRTSIENGFDEDAQRSSMEELNGFPAARMILNPSGCAFYEFDVRNDEWNLFVQPAHKQGDYHEDFCNKAPITVDVNLADQSSSQQSFRCFEANTPDGEPIDPCSPSPCFTTVSSFFPEENKANISLWVKICSDADSSHTAAIWEVNFSRVNDSMKIEGVFPDVARDRISHVQDTLDFNTQLSIASIVGKRGAGKSTVASFLSGNSSMFLTGDGSSGTTTEGADISTTLPAIEWVNTLGEKIQRTITTPGSNMPVFLIDSEGMDVRGDTFDFITTSPPAIIAKLIMYFSEGSLTTDELLNAINEYMNGLDNIVIDTDLSMKDTIEGCDTPSYGHFISVINKMMGDDSDEKLQAELMDPEPEYTEDAKRRNEIRHKLETCFDGVTVHGLPYLDVPPDTPIDYPILDNRFRDGLSKIANSIVERLQKPRIVTVAGEARELNATNAESIISTVITEANSGKIDLGGFDTFWEFTKNDLEIFLRGKSDDLSPISPNCNKLPEGSGYECTGCVCSYRKSVVEAALAQVESSLDMAKVQAMSMFGVDLDKYIPEFLEDVVEPWNAENLCSVVSTNVPGSDSIFDISTISLGESSSINCDMGFFCNQNSITTNDVTITANQIWIELGTSITNVDLCPGGNGADGSTDGESGSTGETGKNAPNLSISAGLLMETSDKNLQFISNGGDGGNGGNGHEGRNNMDQIPPSPSVDDVVNKGTQYDSSSQSTGKHCKNAFGHHECETFNYYWYYQLPVQTDATCGGTGGNAGNGGDGGIPGILSVSGESGLIPLNTRTGGRGGIRGNPGNGGYGEHYNMIFRAYKLDQQGHTCHSTHSCDVSDNYSNHDYGNTDSSTSCPGAAGLPGVDGKTWTE